MVTKFYAFLGKINKLNMLNATVASEKWVAEVCSILWEQKLKRSSIFTANADSYDLEGSSIAVQVTSNMGAKKIRETISEFETRQYAVTHPVLYIVLLGDRPNYTSKELGKAIGRVTFNFNRIEHIIGTDQLIALVANLDIASLKGVLDMSRNYFEHESTTLVLRRKELGRELTAYKEQVRLVSTRLFAAQTLVDKYSHKPSSRASCSRVGAVIAKGKKHCSQVRELYTTIAKATPQAPDWELNLYEKWAVETAHSMQNLDADTEDLMRNMEREWELGSMIAVLEAGEKEINDLNKELAELDKEKDAIEKEMQSLEFALKILAP